MNFFLIFLISFPIILTASSNVSILDKKRKLDYIEVEDEVVLKTKNQKTDDQVVGSPILVHEWNETPTSTSSENETNDMEVTLVTDSAESEFNEIQALCQNNPFLMLPENVIGHIASYLRYPFHILSPVCKCLNQVFKEVYTPQVHLQCASSIVDFRFVPNSRELFNLLSFPRAFIQDRFDQLIFPGSCFIPSTAQTVYHAVNHVLKTFPEIAERNLYIVQLVEHLKIHGSYQCIMTVLKLVPGIRLDLSFDYLYGLYGELLQSRPTMRENLGFVIKGIRNPLNVLYVALSYPVNLQVDFVVNFLNSIDRNFGKDLFLQNLAFCCLKFNVSELNLEKQQRILERNRRLIEHFVTGANEHIVTYVNLCNDMKFSTDFRDARLKKEFLDGMAALPGAYRNFETLIRIAIERKYIKIFGQIIRSPHFGARKSSSFKQLLMSDPHLISTLPNYLFNNIFGTRNQIFRWKHGRIADVQIPQIKNTFEKIRVLLETSTAHDVLIAQISSIHDETHFNILKLVEKIIKKSDNPARKVHLVLTVFSERVFTDSDISYLSLILGRDSYISSLIKPENVDIFTLPNQSLYITINSYNFRAFFEAAKTVGTERLAPLTKHLLINWYSVFKTPLTYAHEYEQFLRLLGLNLENIQMFRPRSDEVQTAIELFISDSRNLFNDMAAWSNYIGELLYEIAYKIYLNDLSDNRLFALDRNNPCVMKCFPIYHLLMENNVEHFISYAPKTISKLFNPTIPFSLIRKVLLNPIINKKLASRTLKDLESFKLSINTVSELNNFFSVAIPYLHKQMPSKLILEVSIYWERIINSAEDVNDFAIIIMFMKPEEFNEKVTTFNQTEKIEQFIQAYENILQTNLSLVGKNRDLLTRYINTI